MIFVQLILSGDALRDFACKILPPRIDSKFVASFQIDCRKISSRIILGNKHDNKQYIHVYFIYNPLTHIDKLPSKGSTEKFGIWTNQGGGADGEFVRCITQARFPITRN